MTDKFEVPRVRFVDGANDDFASGVKAWPPWWTLSATNVDLNMIMDDVCFWKLYGIRCCLDKRQKSGTKLLA